MKVLSWRHRSNIAGKSNLYCRIVLDGQRAEVGSTGLTIYHDYRDGERISDKDPEAAFKNEMLDIMRNDLRATFNQLFRAKEKITAGKIKRLYLEKPGANTFLSAFTLYLQDSEQDQERDLKKSTLTVYQNVRKKLTSFLIEEGATDLLLEDFDLAWVKRFRRWMKQVPLSATQIGHADSYIVKQTQTIKNVLIWAKLHKLCDENPLEGLRIKGLNFQTLFF